MFPDSLTRHDLTLAGIAVVLVAAGLLGVLSPLGLVVSLAGASLISLGGMGYVLFYRPPTPGTAHS